LHSGFCTVLWLSGLKRISIDARVLLDTLPIWRLHETSQLSPGSVHASELNLIGCLLDRKLARLLFEACSGLKSLVYSQLDNVLKIGDILEPDWEPNFAYYDPRRARPYEESIVDPDWFSVIIQSYRDTLKNLQINFLQLNGGSMNSSLKFKNLRNFRSLVSLAIEDRHLGIFHDLPPQLKHLTLRAWKNIKLPFDSSDFIWSLLHREEQNGLHLRACASIQIW
jgi:hypothetical protein